jgi:hypothetical protein
MAGNFNWVFWVMRTTILRFYDFFLCEWTSPYAKPLFFLGSRMMMVPCHMHASHPTFGGGGRDTMGLLSIINFYFIIVNLVEQGTKQPLLR